MMVWQRFLVVSKNFFPFPFKYTVRLYPPNSLALNVASGLSPVDKLIVVLPGYSFQEVGMLLLTLLEATGYRR